MIKDTDDPEETLMDRVCHVEPVEMGKEQNPEPDPDTLEDDDVDVDVVGPDPDPSSFIRIERPWRNVMIKFGPDDFVYAELHPEESTLHTLDGVLSASLILMDAKNGDPREILRKAEPEVDGH
jgi:hypothetical protein